MFVVLSYDMLCDFIIYLKVVESFCNFNFIL